MAATSAFDLETALAERRRLHRYRTRLTIDAPAGRETVIDGRRYLNFCANDYLGLANHPDVIHALKQAADDIGDPAGQRTAVIAQRAGVKIARLNVGGGFPNHRAVGVEPQLDATFATIDRVATEAFGADRPALVCEPGRAMCGDAFTLADCAAAPSLFYADWVHRIGDDYPRLRAYRSRLLARPAFARAVDEARPYRHLFPLGAPARD